MLSEDEASALLARLSKEEWRYRWGYRVSQVALWIALLSAAASISFCVKDADKYSNQSGIALAILIFFPALVGVIQEWVLGFHRWARIVVPVLVSVFAFGLFVSQQKWMDATGEITAGVSAALLLFGGWGFLMARFADGNRMKGPLEQGIKDAKEKVVLVFEESIPPLNDGTEVEPSSVKFEILPGSHLVYSVNGQLAKKHQVLHPVETLKDVPDAVPAFYRDLPGDLRDADADFSIRPMAEEEVQELKRVSPRILRRAFVYLLTGIWFSAQGIRLVENMLLHQFGSGLSGWGWLFALGFGLTIWWREFRIWLKMRRDLKEPQVIVWNLKRPRGHVTSGETLARSRLDWAINGQPVGWRKRSF